MCCWHNWYDYVHPTVILTVRYPASLITSVWSLLGGGYGNQLKRVWGNCMRKLEHSTSSVE